MVHLVLAGLNLTGAVIATACLMDGEPVLISLFFGSTLPITSAAAEFLILGAAPALLCHLLSCLLLTAYYRKAHNWRQIGGERDLECCTCCCCCFCFARIGRLCSQENPVVGEIPIWEQVGSCYWDKFDFFLFRLKPRSWVAKKSAA